MKKLHFFKGLSWLLLLNLLVKPVWIFLVDRQVQNTIGHETYGTYFALLSLCMVLLFVADAGLSNMLVQRVAANAATSTLQLLRMKLLLLLVYMSACSIVAWLSGLTEWQLLAYVVLIQAAGSLLLFLRSVLTANQYFRADAWFSVADKSLAILLCSLFLYGWWQPITLALFLQVQVGALLLACAGVFLVLAQRGLLAAKGKTSVRQILRQVLPFALIILLMSAHYRLDGFLLERVHTNGALQAGIYAMAYRMLDAGNMVGYLTASFLVAFVARNRNDQHTIQNVITFARHGLLLLAIAASCFAGVFAPWIQEVLYHTTNTFTNRVIQLTLAVLPAYYLVHIYGSVLTATARFRTFITILAFAVVVNAALNLILIPAYGAMGSAIAALVSQYGCAAACYWAVSRQLQLADRTRHWFAYFAGAGAVLLALLALQQTLQSVWIILAAITVLALVLILVLRNTIKNYYRSFIQ